MKFQGCFSFGDFLLNPHFSASSLINGYKYLRSGYVFLDHNVHVKKGSVIELCGKGSVISWIFKSEAQGQARLVSLLTKTNIKTIPVA